MGYIATAVCGFLAGGILLATQTGAFVPVLSAAGVQVPSSTQKWKPQFPRPGATKILETDEVIAWDDVHTTYDHWHKHIFGGVMVYIQNGPWTATSPCDGDDCPSEKERTSIYTVMGNVVTGPNTVANPHPFESILGHHGYVGVGLGPHTEAALANAVPRRAVFVEIKRTLAPDAAEWSTDPTGETDKNWPVWETPEPSVLPTIHATQKKWPSLGEAMLAAGAKKTIDNDYVTVWDETLTRTTPILHKNARNVIAVAVFDAPVRLHDGEGGKPVDVPAGFEQTPRRRMPSVYELKAGTGPYDEIAVDPQAPRRTIWIELKGTEAAGCQTWSNSCN